MVRKMFIDTHEHVDHPKFFSDRKTILKVIKDLGIKFVVNPATGMAVLTKWAQSAFADSIRGSEDN